MSIFSNTISCKECSVCEECGDEKDENGECVCDDYRRQNTCSVCNMEYNEDDIQWCKSFNCNDNICVECLDRKCLTLEIDGEVLNFCHESCIENYKVKNNIENEEDYEEIYNKLQNEWINVWKEDNCYLAKENNDINNDGSFSQSIAQSPFEVYVNGHPDYIIGGDGYWAPTLQEFIDYQDKEEWECEECKGEYDYNMRKCRVDCKIVCENCE